MPPGPKPLPRERVYHATWAILEELTTIDGMPFDDWLMKLTPEEVEALQRPPTRKRTSVARHLETHNRRVGGVQTGRPGEVRGLGHRSDEEALQVQENSDAGTAGSCGAAPRSQEKAGPPTQRHLPQVRPLWFM